jgi:hypothetical protein
MNAHLIQCHKITRRLYRGPGLIKNFSNLIHLTKTVWIKTKKGKAAVFPLLLQPQRFNDQMASRMMQNPFCILLWRHKDMPHRNSNTQVFEFRGEPRTCAAAKPCAKVQGWSFASI